MSEEFVRDELFSDSASPADVSHPLTLRKKPSLMQKRRRTRRPRLM